MEARPTAIVLLLALIFTLVVAEPEPQQWDVDRLIRARNPGAVFSTTERSTTTWQTLRSITYNPQFDEGSVGSASVEEASLVRRVRPTKLATSSVEGWRGLSSGLLTIFSIGLCLLLQ